jgi:hypothetical protein
MIRFALAASALVLAGACTHDAPAPAPAPAPQAPRMPVTGGYAPADINNADVKAARDFAVAELYRRFPQRAIVEGATAEQQVVAGMNYRFEITMSGGKKYRAVVYRNLQGAMSVTTLEALP